MDKIRNKINLKLTLNQAVQALVNEGEIFHRCAQRRFGSFKSMIRSIIDGIGSQ
jgi:hypothetical protein